jgi:integrase
MRAALALDLNTGLRDKELREIRCDQIDLTKKALTVGKSKTAAESGAGDEVIMSIAGHVSRAMLSRYSHIRMEAKRRALDEIAARRRTADEKRKQEIERQQAVVISQILVVQ